MERDVQSSEVVEELLKGVRKEEASSQETANQEARIGAENTQEWKDGQSVGETEYQSNGETWT